MSLFSLDVKPFYRKNGLFPYETDGLIFTPALFGVGNKAGESSRPMKTTWIHSFKWKPAEYNTIDFLVSVAKDKSGGEKIGNIFKNGMDTASEDQILQYKMLLFAAVLIQRSTAS